MRLRRAPEIIFKEDVSIEQGTEVLNLLSRLEHERNQTEDGIPAVVPGAVEDEDSL